MGLLLLKSTVCLAILMLFYKLVLENLSIHHFKRYYLLGALIISAIIPSITFIEYIEPVAEVVNTNFNTFETLPTIAINNPEPEPINYLPIILWSLYGLGVTLFAFRFLLNLFRVLTKINTNEKQKEGHYISVLLNDFIVPHTFFNYIFLNKKKYKAKAIPKEVLLHEQTHAKQKHSLDILFIELIQVIFWFNPILYFLKKDIKLNHEFLADNAVLKQGIDSSTYQNLLLQFTSTVNEIPLAHAINYSLIKKRFTIMKTQTSKKSAFFKSLLLLPLLGTMLFSFSTKKQVEKKLISEISINKNTTKHTARSITVDVFANGTYKIDGIKANKKTFSTVLNQLHQDITAETRNRIINIHINSPKEISNKEVWFIYNAVQDYGYHRIVAYNQEIIRAKGNTPFALNNENKQVPALLLNEEKNRDKNKAVTQIKEELKTVEALKIKYTNNQKPLVVINGIECDACQLNLSKQGIENLILSTTIKENITSFKFKLPGKKTESIKDNKLNATAKSYLKGAEKGDIIQLFDLKSANHKYSPILITIVDKNDANYSHSPEIKKGEVPNIPPPPPAAPTPPETNKNKKTGFIIIHGEKHFYAIIDGKTKYYNRWGIEVDKNGTKLSTTQTEGDKVIPGQRITKVYDNNKIVSEFKKTWEDTNLDNIPPPPPPRSTSDHIVSMAKKGAYFYYNGESITSDNAIQLAKTNPNINISSHTDNGTSTVSITSSPVKNRNTSRAIKAKQLRERQKAINLRKEERENALKNRRDAMLKRRTRLPLSQQFDGLEAKGTTFYYEGEKITEAKAKQLVEDNPKLNVSMHNSNGVGTVHLSKKGIKTINGKIVDKKKGPNVSFNNLSKTTNLTVNATYLNELKTFDWSALPIIFKTNKPEQIITLNFNLDKKLKIGNSTVDTFKLELSGKTSELSSMIEKSKKIINKLNNV